MLANSEGAHTARQLYPQGVFSINKTKVIAISKGTSYLKIAEEQDISLARLFEFNDLTDGDIAPEDGLLFLQRKRKVGAAESHIIAPGETLYSIAQAEGIRLESLLQYNQLSAHMQVAAGEKLYLQGQAPSMPRLAGERMNNLTAFQAPAQEESPQAALILHVVQPKETMYSIARKYEVGVEEVKKWNEMATTDLKIGQQIRINKSR